MRGRLRNSRITVRFRIEPDGLQSIVSFFFIFFHFFHFFSNFSRFPQFSNVLHVHEVCRAGSSSVSSFCISEDKPANAYRLVDNQLVEYIPEQDVNVHFFFDDEIIFKCSESSHRNLDGTTEPISSVCSATGKWTVAQPMCKGKCEKLITVKQNEHACGVWTTENFPEPYENDMSCPVRFEAEDPETRFKIQIRFVLLEYRVVLLNVMFWAKIKFGVRKSYLSGNLSNLG